MRRIQHPNPRVKNATYNQLHIIKHEHKSRREAKKTTMWILIQIAIEKKAMI